MTHDKAQSRQDLANQAIEARRHAYAPYSLFPVGAALRTKNGKVFMGCNVENASFGLTICAERGAAIAAVAAGEQEFESIAIASRGGVTPCGACRQVLGEFGPEMEVYLTDVERPEKINTWKLTDLLPGQFVLDKSNRKQ
jgi:cytidine deaminase